MLKNCGILALLVYFTSSVIAKCRLCNCKCAQRAHPYQSEALEGLVRQASFDSISELTAVLVAMVCYTSSDLSQGVDSRWRLCKDDCSFVKEFAVLFFVRLLVLRGERTLIVFLVRRFDTPEGGSADKGSMANSDKDSLGFGQALPVRPSRRRLQLQRQLSSVRYFLDDEGRDQADIDLTRGLALCLVDSQIHKGRASLTKGDPSTWHLRMLWLVVSTGSIVLGTLQIVLTLNYQPDIYPVITG